MLNYPNIRNYTFSPRLCTDWAWATKVFLIYCQQHCGKLSRFYLLPYVAEINVSYQILTQYIRLVSFHILSPIAHHITISDLLSVSLLWHRPYLVAKYFTSQPICAIFTFLEASTSY